MSKPITEGFECDNCGYPYQKVLRTKKRPQGGIYRHRMCTSCGERFGTVEQRLPKAGNPQKKNDVHI
jgi:transcriptional regulator NrdR family protein